MFFLLLLLTRIVGRTTVDESEAHYNNARWTHAIIDRSTSSVHRRFICYTSHTDQYYSSNISTAAAATAANT
uniref:Putative secreted protein n=1 Tax=Anopheles darlingi TaxID=43151 RepID=A0A2M4DAP4_ANODA